MFRLKYKLSHHAVPKSQLHNQLCAESTVYSGPMFKLDGLKIEMQRGHGSKQFHG